MNGYLAATYAQSLREFGEPRRLPRCGGWILKRTIPGTELSDAMGCYPLFVCADWSEMGRDLDELFGEIVSLTLISDPFADYSPAALARDYPDRCVPFKSHFIAEVDRRAPCSHVTRHHRYYARRALRTVSVQSAEDPQQHLDDWCRLYRHVVQRHSLSGIKAFSRDAFAKQLGVPGCRLLLAREGADVIAGQIWYLHQDRGYSHLTASRPRGYDLRVTYALCWRALELLADEVRFLDFGAGAGLTEDVSDGLATFKAGWSNAERKTWLLGRVFDRTAYDDLCRQTGQTKSTYFPAYRHGELA